MRKRRASSARAACVGADRGRFTAKARNALEHANDAVASHAVIDCDLAGLLGEVIDNGKALQAPTVGEPVHDEIHRPDLIRAARQQRRLPFESYAFAAASAANGKACKLVEPVNALVIGLHAFSAKQHMEPAVAEAPSLVGELDHPRLDRLVLRVGLGLMDKARARKPHKPAGAANRDPGFLSHRRHRRALGLRAQR